MKVLLALVRRGKPLSLPVVFFRCVNRSWLRARQRFGPALAKIFWTERCSDVDFMPAVHLYP